MKSLFELARENFENASQAINTPAERELLYAGLAKLADGLVDLEKTLHVDDMGSALKPSSE